MSRILYMTETGFIFNYNPAEKLTDTELELIGSGIWGLISVTDEEHENTEKGRCMVTSGAIAMLPEDQWPENRVEETEQ